jgi:hypothetical protein
MEHCLSPTAGVFYCLPCPQVVLEGVGMYAQYKWVWAGLAFLAGCYALMGGLVCVAFAITPVSTEAPAGVLCMTCLLLLLYLVLHTHLHVRWQGSLGCRMAANTCSEAGVNWLQS